MAELIGDIPQLPQEGLLHSRNFSFTIPWEPKGKSSNLAFNRKTGHAYRPKEYVERKNEIYSFVNEAIPFDSPRPLFEAGVDLLLEVEFVFGYRKGDYGTGRNSNVLKPSAPYWYQGGKDIDNLLKPLKDALSGLVYKDDKQIKVYRNIQMLYGEIPRTEIYIEELQ